MLKDGAMTSYLGQSAATKTNWTTLQDTFQERYFPQEINKWKQTSQVWSMKQGKEQSAVDFMSGVEVEASRAGIKGDQLRCVVVKGLLPYVRQFVVTREGNDVNSLRKWFTVADAAAERDPNVDISSAVKDIQRRLEEMRIHAAYPSNNERKVAFTAQGTIHSTFTITISFARHIGSQSVGVSRQKLA